MRELSKGLASVSGMNELAVEMSALVVDLLANASSGYERQSRTSICMFWTSCLSLACLFSLWRSSFTSWCSFCTLTSSLVAIRLAETAV